MKFHFSDSWFEYAARMEGMTNVSAGVPDSPEQGSQSMNVIETLRRLFYLRLPSGQKLNDYLAESDNQEYFEVSKAAHEALTMDQPTDYQAAFYAEIETNHGLRDALSQAGFTVIWAEDRYILLPATGTVESRQHAARTAKNIEEALAPYGPTVAERIEHAMNFKIPGIDEGAELPDPWTELRKSKKKR